MSISPPLPLSSSPSSSLQQSSSPPSSLPLSSSLQQSPSSSLSSSSFFSTPCQEYRRVYAYLHTLFHTFCAYARTNRRNRWSTHPSVHYDQGRAFIAYTQAIIRKCTRIQQYPITFTQYEYIRMVVSTFLEYILTILYPIWIPTGVAYLLVTHFQYTYTSIPWTFIMGVEWVACVMYTCIRIPDILESIRTIEKGYTARIRKTSATMIQDMQQEIRIVQTYYSTTKTDSCATQRRFTL